MLENLTPFLLHWGITSLSLLVTSYVFSGIKFADTPSLVISALLLGFGDILDRHGGVDAMLVEEVDHLCAQPF